jgi:hypothetical protein
VWVYYLFARVVFNTISFPLMGSQIHLPASSITDSVAIQNTKGVHGNVGYLSDWCELPWAFLRVTPW